MSLCRLWQKVGKEKDAKRLLAKVYRWFTDGFDTEDLKQAKSLLHQLSLMLLAVRIQLLSDLLEWHAL